MDIPNFASRTISMCYSGTYPSALLEAKLMGRPSSRAMAAGSQARVAELHSWCEVLIQLIGESSLSP